MFGTVARGWQVRLYGLRKGTLVYRVNATDNMLNLSKTVPHSQKLTRW